MKSRERMTEDWRLVKNIVLLILVTVLPISQASAAAQTHSREEIKRFSDATSQLVMADGTEQRWDGILALENFLAEFSQTFLKGDAAEALFGAYSDVVDDPGFLLRLAEEAIALHPTRNGLYKKVVQTFVDKGIFPDRTLTYAQKSLKLAENMQRGAGDYYGREVSERLELLSQAYQLANLPDKAVVAMKRSLEKANALSETAYPDQATRQKTIDGIRLNLLRLYIDQGRWDPAYELACDLLKTAVSREPVFQLWSTAYVGKFGSADRIISAYADLKGAIEESRRSRLIVDRVKRPAPAFDLETIKDERSSMNVLKGKVVVLNFWASWCGPCLEELPQLEALARTYKQESVAFLAVNLDTQEKGKRKDLISDTKARLAPSLTYLMGNEEIQREFGIDKIPYTCIVDREGYIRYEKTGLSSDFKATMADQLTWVIGLSE